MKWLLFFILTFSVFAQEPHIDHEARRKITAIEQRLNALEERHNDLKGLIRENIVESKSINQKVDRLIFGENGQGLSEKVAINTKFRSEVEKFVWVLVSALIAQFVLFVGAILKIRKILNLVK